MGASFELHIVASSGEDRERIAGALAGLDPALHEGVDGFREAAGEERCAVVVDVAGGIKPEALLELCAEVADRDREWMVLMTEGDGDDLALRPVSAGFPLEPRELEAALSPDREASPPLELHEVLRFVARIRHDINNPLTAGMAETQLLLMDLEGQGEVGRSLETIERQLQRIQALVQDLTRLRRPVRDHG